MRWRFGLLGLIGLLLATQLLGCSSGRRFKGGLVPSDTTTSEQLEDLRGEPERYALVVGVNRYSDPAFPPLRYAENDADSMAEYLRSDMYGGFDHVEVMLGSEGATRRDVLQRIAWYETHLRRQDTLVIYFSGHGTLRFDERSDEPILYLLAPDSRSADLAGSAIELPALQRVFSRVRARRKALIIDACYNGRGKSSLAPETREVLRSRARSQGLSNPLRAGGNEAYLFATALNYPAIELEELEHGVYTYYLLQAMSWDQGTADTDTDGLITIWEAHDHARSQTLARTAGDQIPEAEIHFVGVDDLVLAGQPERRLEMDLALLFDYSPDWEGALVYANGQERGTFPSTVALPTGAQRITVRTPGGEVLFDEVVRLEAGTSYAVSDLEDPVRRVRPWSLSAQAALRLSPAETIQKLYGWGTVGVEVSLSHQTMRRRARGLTWAVGGGYAPGFVPLANAAAPLIRHDVWLLGRLGARRAFGRITLGAMLGTRLHVLTSAACEEALCGTWVIPELSAVFEQQLALGNTGPRLAFTQEVVGQALDLTLSGQPTPTVDLRFGLGLAFPLR